MEALKTIKLVEVTLVLAIDTDTHDNGCAMDYIHTDGVQVIGWHERELEATYKETAQ